MSGPRFRLRTLFLAVALVALLLASGRLWLQFFWHPTMLNSGWVFHVEASYLNWERQTEFTFFEIKCDPGWWEGDWNEYIDRRTLTLTLLNWPAIDNHGAAYRAAKAERAKLANQPTTNP